MPLPHQLRTSSSDSTFALQQSHHWPEPYRCTETKHIPCHLLRLSPQQFQAMFLYRCTFDLADQHFTITDCKRNNRQNLTHNKHTRAPKHMHSALLIAISGNDAIYIHGCQQCQPIMEGIAIHCHRLLTCTLDIQTAQKRYSSHGISTYMLQLNPALQFQGCLNGTGGAS